MNVIESQEIPGNDSQKTLEDMERDHIRMMLKYHDWSRENSARALGISQKTLYTKINKYNLRND